MRIIEVYTRIFITLEQLEATVQFYRSLLDGKESLRFSDPQTGLTIAAISSEKLSVLVIAGSAKQRQPYEETKLTIKVTSLTEAREILLGEGALELEAIQPTPVGRKMRFRHHDGVVVEYVEHNA